VDDIYCTGSNSEATLAAVIGEISSIFDVRDLGTPRTYLGLNFNINSDSTCTLSQEDYLETLLVKFNMEAAHPASTPGASDFGNISVGSEPLLDSSGVALYQSLVGGLQWLATCTRPDISYVVSVLQRYMTRPVAAHMTAAKRVLRYLKGNPGGIIYSGSTGESPPQLRGYADASFASDPNTRRSHTGYVFMLGSAAVAWRSKLQSSVTLSTAEAEYVALCSATVAVIPLVQLLNFLGVTQQGAVCIYEDNSAAVRLAKDRAACKRTKHIDVKYHFVREQVAAGVVEVVAVRTQEQHADLLTKSLSQSLHQYHASVISGAA
jgi:hypothetical protein